MRVWALKTITQEIEEGRRETKGSAIGARNRGEGEVVEKFSGNEEVEKNITLIGKVLN